MPPCNMQMVESWYSVVQKKGWLVFVVVLAVLWRRSLVCNKYRTEELKYRSKGVVGTGSAGNEIQEANGQMEVVKTAVI